MRWLIVEDALRDRKGHWFEYVGTFARELRDLGDEVTILADRSAEPFLVEQLKVQPVLPPSIWHRMSDGSGPLRRYLRVPVHAWKTYQSLKKYLRNGNRFEVIFVPTVLVHHLLGWTYLIKRVLKLMPGRVVLFFPNTPVKLDSKTNEPSWQPAPTAKLFCRLIRSLNVEVKRGRVILGVETQPMREALTQLTGVPFTYFPHPVQPLADEAAATSTRQPATRITVAAYGSARHEKGSDLLVEAVAAYCRRNPDIPVNFILQSVEGDDTLWRRLQGNPQVRLIPNYFANGEYTWHLRAANVLLLPYRRSSYGLRVSRVVIEAMVNGIPVVVTRGTTLAQQAEEFGAAVLCDDESVENLTTATETVTRDYEALATKARARRTSAREHFSVGQFRRSLLANRSHPSNQMRLQENS